MTPESKKAARELATMYLETTSADFIDPQAQAPISVGTGRLWAEIITEALDEIDRLEQVLENEKESLYKDDFMVGLAAVRRAKAAEARLAAMEPLVKAAVSVRGWARVHQAKDWDRTPKPLVSLDAALDQYERISAGESGNA